MFKQGIVHANEDPVCAMAIDPAEAIGSGLALRHDDIDYVFCSTGCFLEFREDPAWFLDPAYTPMMT
jgi:YHS domain-containing protein